jgi:hypothetical protein
VIEESNGAIMQRIVQIFRRVGVDGFGYIHRDIAHDVMQVLGEFTGNLIDFGIGKVGRGRKDRHSTHRHSFMGSPFIGAAGNPDRVKIREMHVETGSLADGEERETSSLHEALEALIIQAGDEKPHIQMATEQLLKTLSISQLSTVRHDDKPRLGQEIVRDIRTGAA